MADKYQTIAIPGAGDIQFPASMSDDDIHDAILTIHPDPAASAKQAAMLGALGPKPAPSPSHAPLPSLFDPNSLPLSPAGKARRTFEYQRQAGAREFNQELEQPNAPTTSNGKLLATTPMAPAPPRTAQENQDLLGPRLTPTERGRLVASQQPNRGGIAPVSPEQQDVHQKLAADEAVREREGNYYTDIQNRPLANDLINSQLRWLSGNKDFNFDELAKTALARGQRNPGTLEAPPQAGTEFLKGVGRGVWSAEKGISTPESLEMAAALPFAGEGALGKAISLGFTGQQAYVTGAGLLRAGKRYGEGDIPGMAEELTGAGINAGFGALGAMHLLPGEKPLTPEQSSLPLNDGRAPWVDAGKERTSPWNKPLLPQEGRAFAEPKAPGVQESLDFAATHNQTPVPAEAKPETKAEEAKPPIAAKPTESLPPKSEQLQRIADSLDRRNAPDADYRNGLPNNLKTPLKAGETWQSRLQNTIAAEKAKETPSLKTPPPEAVNAEPAKAEGSPSTPATPVQEPVPPTETPKVGTTSESTTSATKPEGQGAEPVKGGTEWQINDTLRQIQEQHGNDGTGAAIALFDAVSKKYQTPELLNRVYASLSRRLLMHLHEDLDDPLTPVLETLGKLPEDKGDATLHANPLGALYQKFFGARQTPIVRAPLIPGVIDHQSIVGLTQGLESRPAAPADQHFKAFLANETDNFVKSWQELPGAMKQRWQDLNGFFNRMVSAYRDRPGLTPIDLHMGVRSLHLQQASVEMQDFVDKMKANHPDLLRQSAIMAWVEAGGGRLPDADVDDLVRDQGHDLAGKAAVDRMAGRFSKIYKAAAELTPEERATAYDYRDYLSHLEAREAAKGLVHDTVLDYVQHIWSRDNFVQSSVAGIRSGAGFSTSATFAMGRTKFDDYYQGILAGYKPNSLAASYVISARAMSSARILANREFVDAFRDHTMPDGLKAVLTEGVGTPVPNPTDADKAGAILIKSAAGKAAETADGVRYVNINHPSFKNWKWVGSAPDGTDVLYKGSMVVHPELAEQFKRLLEPSAVRNNPLGKALLGASSVGKQTLLSLGLFHPIQLGVHLLEHVTGNPATSTTTPLRALNPFSNEKFINLDDPVQQMLVIHGLQLRMFDAESLMDEGVMSRGFVTGAPYLGRAWGAVHDAMFQKMIPNMKMAMAQDILKRNIERYHDQWTQQEIVKAYGQNYAQQNVPPGLWTQASQSAQSRIYRLTAEQTNAAFGGIDWSKMPVNKTGQDFLRLTVLAPDFLLARMQFVGDAFRPGGAESRKALGVGFALQYLMARALNSSLNDGDAKWDIHDWNKIVVGHNSFSLRTVQGDLLDAVLDPRTFLEHRINPLWRAGIEAYTHKDVFGHPVNAGQIMLDAAKNFVPMPLQGAADSAMSRINPNMRSGKHDENIINTIVQSVGVQMKKYRTPAERDVFNAFDAIQPTASQDDLALEQKNSFNYLRDKYREGKLKDDDIETAMEGKGKYVPGIGHLTLKPSEAQYLFKTKPETQLVTRARQLQPNEVFNAWQKGSEAEKVQLLPLLVGKLKALPPQDQDRIQPILEKFTDSLSDAKQDQIGQKIQDEILYQHPELLNEDEEPPQ